MLQNLWHSNLLFHYVRTSTKCYYRWMGCFSKLLWQKYRNIIGALYGKGLLSMVYCYSYQEFSACFIYIQHTYISSCTMAEVVHWWSVTTEAWVQSKASLCWIFGGLSNTGSGFTSLVLPQCSIFIRPSAKPLCDLCDWQQCLKKLFHVW